MTVSSAARRTCARRKMPFERLASRFESGTANDRKRRVSPVAPRPREGPMTEPTAGAQPWPRERVLMPRSRHSGRHRAAVLPHCVLDRGNSEVLAGYGTWYLILLVVVAC